MVPIPDICKDCILCKVVGDRVVCLATFDVPKKFKDEKRCVNKKTDDELIAYMKGKDDERTSLS
jgi:hypothetical protein